MKNRNRSLDDPWQISQDQGQVKEFSGEPKGNDFWARPDDLCRLLDNAGVVSSWNMGFALGETIKEKMDSFLIHIKEVTQFLVAHGAQGYFWIAADSETVDLIKCVNLVPPCRGRIGDPPFDAQYQMGGWIDGVYDEGTILQKWRLFMCPRLANKHLLIGVNNSEEDLLHYARIAIRD